jgi:chromosome segregation ATPase
MAKMEVTAKQLAVLIEEGVAARYRGLMESNAVLVDEARQQEQVCLSRAAKIEELTNNLDSARNASERRRQSLAAANQLRVELVARAAKAEADAKALRAEAELGPSRELLDENEGLKAENEQLRARPSRQAVLNLEGEVATLRQSLLNQDAQIKRLERERADIERAQKTRPTRAQLSEARMRADHFQEVAQAADEQAQGLLARLGRQEGLIEKLNSRISKARAQRNAANVELVRVTGLLNSSNSMFHQARRERDTARRLAFARRAELDHAMQLNVTLSKALAEAEAKIENRAKDTPAASEPKAPLKCRECGDAIYPESGDFPLRGETRKGLPYQGFLHKFGNRNHWGVPA